MSHAGGRPNKIKRAEVWLQEALSQGPVTAQSLQAAVQADGLSWHTVRRARTNLRLVSMLRDGASVWMTREQAQEVGLL